MDPSIMKLLEEDEDENMHSGADIEAFTTALNRDIEGDTSTSQHSDLHTSLSQGTSYTSNQLLSQWQTSSHDENANCQSQQDPMASQQQQQQHASEMELNQHTSDSEIQQQVDHSQELNGLPLQHKQYQDDSQPPQVEQNALHVSQAIGMQNSEKDQVHIQESGRMHNPDSESQFLKLEKMSNQQAMATGMSNQQAVAKGVSTQQTMATSQAINAMNRGKQVPFGLLLPVIKPQLDKDRGMQLDALYNKLKKNEVSKDGFVRHMRNIVGDQMLKMAVYKLQSQAARNSQTGSNQFPLQSHASAQQRLQMPSIGANQFPESFMQLHQKGPSSSADSSHVSSSAAQAPSESNNLTVDNNAQKPREVERQSDSHGMQVSQMSSSSLNSVNQEWERPTFPIQGLSKQQQQHLHFSQASLPPYGSTGGSYHPYPTTNVNSPATSLKHHPHDSQMRQVSIHQSMGTTQLGTTATNMMSVPRQNAFNESNRVQGTLGHLTNNSTSQQNSVYWQSSTSKEQKHGALSSMAYVKQEPIDQPNEQQHKSQLSTSQGLSSFSPVLVEQGSIPGILKDESFDMQSSRVGFSTPTSMISSNSVSSSMPTQPDPNASLSSRIPSATSLIGPGGNAKNPLKRPIGQKKPLEALGSSPPLSSKKQKVSGASLDQSIEQLNDVTAVSGVNLREEEEQLFSGSKEDSRVSEASRRVVQEEEERLILQRIPLQKKLAEIMTKCGLKSISNDVERCLSLCMEERMRGLISNLIRLSKQRVDIEKPRHRTIITSDVRQQIMIMNQKAREEWEKKQAEAEKLQKLNEPDGDTGVDGDKEKDEGRVKSVKVNKEEDDKMRTTAANVAARAAVGGDDMLSKWQLMAEQARQKREGGSDAASGSQPGKEVSLNSLSTFVQNARDNQEAEKRDFSSTTVATSGAVRKNGRNQVVVPQTRVARSISVKDVIAVLEREPQMSKSTLIYRLYAKVRSDAVAE